MSHPCNSCQRTCVTFWECPRWQDWARRNREEDEYDGEALGDTEDSDDCGDV